jgi:hypothetical protein
MRQERGCVKPLLSHKRRVSVIPAEAGMTMQESSADADFMFQPELLLSCAHEINLLTQDGKDIAGQQ